MKNIVLCTNPRRDADFFYTRSVGKLMEGMGIKLKNALLFCDNGNALPDDIKFVPLEEALRGAELLICLGGDGTILHASKAAAENDVPILGINVGRMGFLADLEASEYRKVIDAINGRCFLDQRMMLRAEVERGGKTIFSDFALNDAVVAKGNVGRIIDLAVYCEDKQISVFSGDGLILATPTGSTAYSMSAGGPIVEPSAENLILTPICAHDLKAKSFVLSSGSEVTIKIWPLHGKTAFLSLDGTESIKLSGGDSIKITKSDHKTKLVRVLNRSFYEIVNQKLGGDQI